MARHPRVIQAMWLLVAAALMASSAAVQVRLNQRSAAYELTTPEDLARNHPQVALLNIAPGGLRAPLVTYLWITADNYKNDGRYFDAMQLADLICTFQPHFEGVWYFHAWNMAWNISAASHNPHERWLWINNGIELLRDRGIPLNPSSMRLYNQLAWIFYSKIGMTMDDMHMSYKQRWAAEMQHVVGAPPEGETSEVIAAFERIANAPLDRDVPRQGKELFQDDQRQVLLSDPQVAQYATAIEAAGLGIDESFLNAYNRFSTDMLVAQTRMFAPKPTDDAEKAALEIVNLPQHQDARVEVLAFIRAQLLWNRYRMDPQWMLSLMKRYNVPLDWRLPWPHAIYWISYGIHVTDSLELADISTINTDRIMLGALHTLAWQGRMTYVANPDRPDEPQLNWFSDYRYIKAAHDEYMLVISAILKTSGEKFDDNPMKNGHINFLIGAIQMLYVQHRYDQAQELLDFIKNDYRMEKHIWALSLEEFMAETITAEDLPTMDLARNQITSALQMGLFLLARGQQPSFRDNYTYAQKVYKAFENAPHADRVKLPPFQLAFAAIASDMIINPRSCGYYLPLAGRQQLFARLDVSVQLMLYDRIATSSLLQREVQDAQLLFQAVFPPPVGIEDYRQLQQTPNPPPALPRMDEDYTG